MLSKEEMGYPRVHVNRVGTAKAWEKLPGE